MTSSSTGPLLRGSADTRLLAYVADLEVEVDRLRRNNRRMYQEARAVVDRVQPLCEAGLAAVCCVLVDDLALCRFVHHGAGLAEQLRRSLITTCDGDAGLLHERLDRALDRLISFRSLARLADMPEC